MDINGFVLTPLSNMAFELTYFSLLLFMQGRTKRSKEKYATQLGR